MHMVLPWHGPAAAIVVDAGAGRRRGRNRPAVPARLGKWPAVIAFAIVIWLELVAFVTGGKTLAIVLLGYTLFTLAGMSWFGRAAWRRNVEVFSVWFWLLGRLSPYKQIGEPEQNQVARRPFASGLFAEPWTRTDLVLVTLGTAAIIFDGLSKRGCISI